MEPIFRKPTRLLSKTQACEKRPFWLDHKPFKMSRLNERLEAMPR